MEPAADGEIVNTMNRRLIGATVLRPARGIFSEDDSAVDKINEPVGDAVVKFSPEGKAL